MPSTLGCSRAAVLRAPRWERPHRDPTLPIQGPRELPSGDPRTQATGHAQWGCPSLPGRGDWRLDGVGLNLGTELAQNLSSAGGRGDGEKRDRGSSLGQESSLEHGGEAGKGLFTGSLSRQL